jgi:N-acetylneuraminate lyase
MQPASAMSQYNVEILPAVFTPFHEDVSIDYRQVNSLYQHCINSGFGGVFLNGTTGECMSLHAEERKKLLEAWVSCRTKNNRPEFKIFVHVGSNNLYEAAALAEHAQAKRADAIAMVPTFYFRPKTLEDLIDQCRYVAAAAPELAFYYYNIPGMTGVNFPLPAFLKAAVRGIATFSGLKNSHHDLLDYQQCLQMAKKKYSLYSGTDELFMMAYVAGNRNYVGSTYNFMSEFYWRLLDAYHACDLQTLTSLQEEASSIYTILNDYNSLIAGKEIMNHLGIPCGPVRKPLKNLTAAEKERLIRRLQQTSFFEFAQHKSIAGNSL